MSKIIGIAGQLAQGKDEVANYLVKKLNKNALYPEDKWKRIGFADAVKKVYMDSFATDLAFIEEWKRKDEVPPEFDLNVRRSLQQIGDGFRKIQNDVWIRTALRNQCNMAISDCRYLNEIKAIKKKHGINILLWRPTFENNDPNPSESQIKPYVDYCAKEFSDGPLLHCENFLIGKARLGNRIQKCKICESELSELKYFDYFLINKGTLEDLYKKIDDSLIPFLDEKLCNQQ